MIYFSSEHRCGGQPDVHGVAANGFSDNHIVSNKFTEINEFEKVEKVAQLDHSDSNNSDLNNYEKSRRQWDQTAPDQVKEDIRSLSQVNLRKTDDIEHHKVDKTITVQSNQSILPPINPEFNSKNCICTDQQNMADYSNDEMIKYIDISHRNDSDHSQWIVQRPHRVRPQDNLKLEGYLDMDTTFKTSYDATAKELSKIRISDHNKNIAVVRPSSKPDIEHEQVNGKAIRNAKKSKNRPTTSLKPGGEGYFTTLSKESYRNFVIIDENSKNKNKTKLHESKRKDSLCCAAAAEGLKLPKVQGTSQDKHKNGINNAISENMISQQNQSIRREHYNDEYQEKLIRKSNCEMMDAMQSNVMMHDGVSKNGPKPSHSKYAKEQERICYKDDHNDKSKTNYKEVQKTKSNYEAYDSNWTIASLEEPKRLYKRDVDNIKELNLIDGNENIYEKTNIKESLSNDKIKLEDTCENKKIISFQKPNQDSQCTSRAESRNYVLTNSNNKMKKHKNESTMKLFQGDMEFSTTNKSYFNDSNKIKGKTQRILTAGKSSRKNGRRNSLFRESSDAEFCDSQSHNHKFNGHTTYHDEFFNRNHCPALDLGTSTSEYQYKGDCEGHKFYLPLVKY